MNWNQATAPDETLMGHLDELTPHALRTLNALPVQERRVFCGLLDLTGTATAAELAKRTRIRDRAIVSTHLKRLRDKGLVSHEKPHHKVIDARLVAWYAMRYRQTLEHVPEETMDAVRNTPKGQPTAAQLFLDTLAVQAAPVHGPGPE